ncbi:MAG: carboxypeptidase regulatory-like domain-containing protein [Candidatus Cloacimonetes bacterium]|nr:carboxypeptidase regulatory-like domain-containing protein [Candidatus Cloacimonadota bacterium]
MQKVTIFSIILLFTLLTTNLFATYIVVRFDDPTMDTVRKFTTDDYDVASCKPGEYLDLVINKTKYNELLDAGYKLTITQTEEQLIRNLRADTELDGYRDYETFVTDLQQFETQNPDICKVYNIGDSWGKIYSDGGNTNYNDFDHEIWALKISDNVNEDEDEPGIYYLAEHHAREPISLEVVMNIIENIVAEYGVDPIITDNVDNQEIWFVPLVNPNGHKVVTDETNVWWRKNIMDNNENGSMDVGYNTIDGVDPNRNYGWQWGGAGVNWSSETYQGNYAFSEPETQAVRNLMASHHFVAGISYHSYGELILYPYGYEDGVIAPDQAALSELSTAMAETIPSYYGGHYTPQAAWALYPCTGTTDDYAYGNHGIFSYTIELATEFIPSAGQISGICNDNLEAAMIMLNRPNHTILRGHITDASTNEPIQAEIFIEGLDDTGEYRNPYLSNEEFGAFYRLLTTGNYYVTFSAYGYESQTLEDVEISADYPTIVDLELNPVVPNSLISGVVTDADTGDPIENAIVELLDHNIPATLTNEDGEYTISNIYDYTYDLLVYKNAYSSKTEFVQVNGNTTGVDVGIYELDDGTFENAQLGGCWDFGGQEDWFIVSSEANSGTYSSRSGVIGHNQKSDIEVSMYVETESVISFFRKVSSEADYDYLKFYIDDELQASWSGNEDWQQVEFPVTPGNMTFRWSYTKDAAVSGGSDCAWIDDILFPEGTLIVTPTLLEFLDDTSLEGLEFSIMNNSNTPIIIDDMDYEGGTGFTWSIPNFNLTLPYTMAAGEQLDFLVMIEMPVESGLRDIVSDFLDIYTDAGDHQVEIVFDTGLYSSAGNDVPLTTRFHGNYPNPFNPTTTFSYTLASDSRVKLTIYNIKGQKIRTLVDNERPAGIYQVVWNGLNDNGKKASSGIYFSHWDAHDTVSDYTSVKKIVLLK